MELLQFFFLIHLIICAVVLVLRIFRVVKCEYITIIIAFLLPVWGFGMMIVKRYSDIHQDRQREKLEVEHMHAEEYLRSIQSDEDSGDAVPLGEAITVNDKTTRRTLMMDILYDVSRSINEDMDDMKDRVVPLEEAMVVNDPATRRALVIDVLYANPADYVSQLLDARENDDTEVVHYAATALAEIQKDFDTRFQELTKQRTEDPEDEATEAEYLRLLERYIESGLLKGDGLRSQLVRYSELLGERLSRENAKGRWTFLSKKADTDLRLGDAEALEEDVRLMEENWPDRDHVFYYRIQCAVLKKDHTALRQVIREIKEKGIYLSAELRGLMEFWADTEDTQIA